MQVENRGDEHWVVGASLACHGSSTLTSSRDRPLEDPNVMFVGAFSGKTPLVANPSLPHIIRRFRYPLLLHPVTLAQGAAADCINPPDAPFSAVADVL